MGGNKQRVRVHLPHFLMPQIIGCQCRKGPWDHVVLWSQTSVGLRITRLTMWVPTEFFNPTADLLGLG